MEKPTKTTPRMFQRATPRDEASSHRLRPPQPSSRGAWRHFRPRRGVSGRRGRFRRRRLSRQGGSTRRLGSLGFCTAERRLETPGRGDPGKQSVHSIFHPWWRTCGGGGLTETRGFFTAWAVGAPHPASTRVTLLLNRVDESCSAQDRTGRREHSGTTLTWFFLVMVLNGMNLKT